MRKYIILNGLTWIFMIFKLSILEWVKWGVKVATEKIETYTVEFTKKISMFIFFVFLKPSFKGGKWGIYSFNIQQEGEMEF